MYSEKYEKTRANENAAGVPDVDYSITNREFARMIEHANISFLALDDEDISVEFIRGAIKEVEEGRGPLYADYSKLPST